MWISCRSHEVQKQLDPSNRAHRPIIDELQERMADKIYVNFSLFQSMPDAWGIDQLFPVMFRHRHGGGDPVAVHVVIDGAIGIAGDVQQHRAALRRLVQPFQRHHREQLILQYVQLDPNTLLTQFRDQVKNTGLDDALQQQFLEEFEAGLYGYTYLEDE